MLPNGAFVALDGDPYAIHGANLLRWNPEGYTVRKQRPSGITADVLTPPSILAVLGAGYRPRWHPSAERSRVMR
jgi:hypothetical protein